MEPYKMTKEELLDIKSIIQFGNRKPEDYHVSFSKKVYDLDQVVRIRGLSNYEYDEIGIEMFDEIKDTATINYVFDSKNRDKLKAIEDKKSDKKDELIDLDKNPENISNSQLLKALKVRNALIVFHAMRDFYKDLMLSQVKQIEGINEIAKRVNEKSGRTKEIQERIEFFRVEQGESKSKDSITERS